MLRNADFEVGKGGKFAFGHEKAGPEHFQSRTLMKRFNVL